MSKLKNTFVDTCVVVGINNEVEFIPSPNTIQDDSSYKYGPYKQYLLAVFNENVAYFPESRTQFDCSPFYEASKVIYPSAEIGDVDVDSHVPGDLPFEMDIIGNLPTFCFPSGGYAYTQSEMLEPEITYLVLTDMDGLRTYAVCITCSQNYMAIKTTGKNNEVQLKNPNLSNHKEYTEEGRLVNVHVPICVCLVSSFPFFNTMKDCLSSLLPQINIPGGALQDWKTVMKLATTLTLVPVPPAGPLAVNFSLFGTQHTIYPPSEADRRVVDIDIHLPLLIFSPEIIVGIVTCLLTQQRMVFMSSSYSLLTIIIESFFTYIDPIKYIHTYVPTLPNSLCDLVEAPGQFIMGVHSSLKSQVKQIRKQAETPNIVLVDIDKGDIDLGDDCNLPLMPDIVAQSLIVRLKKIKPHFDLKLVSMPTMFLYKEIFEQRRNLLAKVRSEIRDAFLDMLVSLFGGMFNYMSIGKQYFDREAFLQSHCEDEQEFFAEVVFTDAFRRFVDERLEKHEIRDEFAVLGERVAEKARSCAGSISTIIRRGRYSTQTTSKIPKLVVFTIPIIPDECLISEDYYQLYCKNLSCQLKLIDHKSIRLKASYIYLRGFAHIACGNPIEGLRDFHALYSLAPELFPKEFTSKLINNLDSLTFVQLQSEAFYKETVTFGRFIKKHEMENSTKVLRDTTVDKSEFEKRWKPLKAALSSESVDWLFGVLAEGSEVIPYQKYIEFCKFYESIQKGSVENGNPGLKLQSSDHLLKVSSLISTEKGMGRLILTTNKLYFMRDGAREEILVTPLCDIKAIISYQKNSVFWSGVDALQIINSDKNISPFYACLKEERDTWVMFLNELSAGHKSSITLREQSMVDIAVTNVMVAQALLQMNIPLTDVEGAFSLAKNKVIENGSLSDDTKEAFEIRLDPCIHDKNRTTVCSIAYVPGNPAVNETPTVWIGLGSGTIVIYETEKWNCISELRYAKSRISKLFLVGTNQIWAGSIDTVIYVINTETRNSEQQLQSHTDFVSDIISHEKTGEDGSTKLLVWSSSYNGQIMCWDPEAREPVGSTTLPKVRTLAQILLLYDTTLWCVTNDEIIVLDTSSDDWCVLQKLVIYDDKKFPILLGCALKVSDDQVWIGSKFGSSAVGALHIWDATTRCSKPAELDGEIQICCMVIAYGSVWVGNKDGRIIVMNTDGKTVEREFHVHEDKVQSMCETPEGHVITGSSSREGKVCVWNAMSEFDVIDGKRKLGNKRTFAQIKESYEVVPLLSDMLSDHFK